MTRRIPHILLLGIALGLFVSPSLARGRGQGNPHKQKAKDQAERTERDRDQDEERDENRDRPLFRKQDREIIIDYFHRRGSGLPPGLAKRNGNLPPGLEMQLERNGTLPPGLQKRVEPLPHELEIRLPRLPVIYRRGRIGADVIILNQKTGPVVDIIRDVATLAGR